ncbi:FAD binding domain-containing protein [Roseovarius sp. LXJ103]|uniref:FAD binding domain-containing protein n=1 Tax=Roseovarius carneus TaxID=2853164 RepID=UPI000D615C3C|nr:FAD binding domain-containing protein [Roseovarius carneus]MBZ8117976.1 FAD binding domain-containing protein [Roseovarius carneus]PWE36273.1 xanthine dehydrogenase [Pelagicola sp. LXJ1103]
MTAYLRPANVSQALDALAEGPAVIAAGCTDLFPATDRRGLEGRVLDITGIGDLAHVGAVAGGVRIGAAVTWSDVIKADLPPAFDMLKEAAREVGSVQIQNAGTLVGNICNASPAADGVPCLLALDAEVEIASAHGLRRVPLSGFITGVRQTLLTPGEMVTGLFIPDGSLGGHSRFLKLGARRYLVISIAMVAARVEVREGRVRQMAVSVGSCSAVATRLLALEEALIGRPVMELSAPLDANLIAPALSPIDDIRADAGYRLEAAAELVHRALCDVAEGFA